ncbi:hypothetical protein [Clostridium botulinum]|uniref:hypothetical protein n=1 Tax=Clostridium botulinum TaxID=1491 RepID=UPI001E294C0B|nr:hypothetical protein [Clostridium botulinum]
METIGTSLKTIFAKFQQVKKDTGEVNKDFSATINTLEKMGVETGSMAGQLKPVGEILQELANKWNDMNDKQKAMVSSSLGVYQISRFSALMQGLAKDVNGVSRSQQIYSEVMKASGETNKQYETYLNSLSGAIDKFKAQWEVVFNNSMNSSTLKSIVNIGTGILNLVDKFGGLNIALVSLGTALLSSNNKFKAFKNSFISIKSEGKGFAQTLMLGGKSLQELKLAFTSASAGGGVFKGTLNMLKTGLTGLKLKAIGAKIAVEGLKMALTLGLSVAITFALEGIMKLINKSSELKQKNQELQQSVQQNIKSNNDMITYLRTEGKEYDNLSKKTKLTTEEQEKLKSIKQQLVDKFPELVKGINSETGEMELQKKSTKELIELLKQKNKLESNKLISGGNDFLKDKQKEYREIQKTIDDLKHQAKNLKNGRDNVGLGSNTYKHTIDGLNEIKRTIGLTKTQQEELDRKTEEYKNILTQVGTKVEEQKQKYSELKPYVQAVFDSKNLDSFQQKLANIRIDPSKFLKDGKLDFTSLEVEIQKFKDSIEKDPNYSNIKMVVSLKDPKADDLKKYFNSILALSKTLKMSPLELTKIMPLSVNKEYLKKNSNLFVKILKDEIKRAGGQDKVDLTQMLKGFDTKEVAKQNAQVAESTYLLNQKQEDLNETYKNAINSAKDYNKYMKEMTENGHLSAESVGEINEKHSDLIPLLGDEKELYKHLESASKHERDVALNAISSKLEGNSTFCSKVIRDHQTAFDEIRNSYNLDLENFKTVATAKAEVDAQLCKAVQQHWIGIYSSMGQGIEALKSATTQEFLNMKAGDTDGTKFLEMQQAYKQVEGLNKGITIMENAINSAKNKIANTSLSKPNFGGIGGGGGRHSSGGGRGRHSSGGSGRHKSSSSGSHKSETQYAYDGKAENIYDATIKTINNSLEKSDKLIDTISQKIANLQSLESKSNFKDILTQENEKLDAQRVKLDKLKSAQSQAESMKEQLKQKFYSNWSWMKGRDLDAMSEKDFTDLYNKYYGQTMNFGTGDGAKKKEEAYKKGAELFKELKKNYEDASNLAIESADKELKLEQEINTTVKERLEVQGKTFETELHQHQLAIDKKANELDVLRITEEKNYSGQSKIMTELLEKKERYLYHVVGIRDELLKQKNMLSENSTEWNLINEQIEEYNNKIVESNKNFLDQQKELKDLAKEKVKELLEQEYKNKERQLEKDNFRFTKEEWEQYQKDKVERIKKNIEKINQFVKDNGSSKYTDDALLAKQIELQMIESKRFDKLKAYQQEFEDIHNLRIKAIDDELDQLNKKNEKEKESEEREKRRIDLEKIRQQLENVRNEKNIQQLTKDENGLYQFVYVADQKKIDDLEDQLKKKQEENTKWQDDLEDKKKRKKLEDKKKYEEDLIKQKQEYHNIEKNKLDEHYSNMDALTKNYMNDLKSTYGDKWDEIIGVLQNKLGEAKRLNEELKEIGSSYSRNQAEDDFLEAKARGDEKGAEKVRNKYRSSSSTSTNSSKSNSSGNSSASSSRPRVSSSDESSFLKAKASGDSKTADSIRKKYASFKTGGYTGAWGKDGKIAVLHEKELILNKDETKNILQASKILKNLNPLSNITMPKLNLPSISNLGIINTKQPQVVKHIYQVGKIECPNVTNDSGINNLFDNLNRLGFQYDPEPNLS